MYLVLDLTNGDGYSTPGIELFQKRSEAYSKFAYHIGWNIINTCTLEDDSTDTKKLFTDGEDNYGVHLLELDNRRHHVINIEGHFVDEVTVSSYSSLAEAKKRLKLLKSSFIESDKNLRDGMEIYGGETMEGYQTNLLIFKKVSK